MSEELSFNTMYSTEEYRDSLMMDIHIPVGSLAHEYARSDDRGKADASQTFVKAKTYDGKFCWVAIGDGKQHSLKKDAAKLEFMYAGDILMDDEVLVVNDSGYTITRVDSPHLSGERESILRNKTMDDYR